MTKQTRHFPWRSPIWHFTWFSCRGVTWQTWTCPLPSATAASSTPRCCVAFSGRAPRAMWLAICWKLQTAKRLTVLLLCVFVCVCVGVCCAYVIEFKSEAQPTNPPIHRKRRLHPPPHTQTSPSQAHFSQFISFLCARCKATLLQRILYEIEEMKKMAA